ncbi:phosphatase PAP2 family protein [Chryseolinea sp. T2]|uniref:phosphatase PAP2 family protein n=1 Tax=Chryseolinea sp. T2 TaxID=3129255 RepID=UPI0030770FBD
MTLARIVSWVFHPLLLATYLFSLFTLLLPAGLDPISQDGQLKFIFLIFCVTFALPALNIFLFKALGTISSVTLESRRERMIPFTFVAILYILITWLLYSRTRISINDNLLKFLVIIDVLVVMATIITFFYKVSVHAMAVWAFIGILLPLNKISEEGKLFGPTLIAILLAGVIMSARLQLNAHTPREVMVGAITGLLLSFGGMMVLF